MKDLYIDIETYSSENLPKCGAHKYAESPDFEILIAAYAFDDEPVQVLEDVSVLREMLYDPDIRKIAYNAQFEMTCFSSYFLYPPMKIEQWEDPMVTAVSCGLPRSLGDVGAALGLPQDKQKDKEGRALITYFSKPCRPTKANGGRTRNLPEHSPEKWEKFKAYCAQDVEAMRAIRKKLIRYIPEGAERDIWILDQEINRRGVRVERKLADQALKLDKACKTSLTRRMKELTGLENPNSMTQLKGWLGTEGSLDKKAVAKMLEGELSDEHRELLMDRQQLGKSSVKKYTAMEDYLCEDGRVHGLFQFYGAGRTGRWAGRGVQLQNLPQNHIPDLDLARSLVLSGDEDSLSLLYGNIPDVLSQLIRTAFIPADGHTFAVADFAAIEARVIAWLAGESWRKRVFLEGGDIYCASASQMFHVPVVKHGENGHLRQKGKIAELALGYGGGTGALTNMGALEMGLAEDELQEIVDKWREASPRIVKLWRDIGDAAMKIVCRESETERVGVLRFIRRKRMMAIELPSGREIRYFDPGLTTNRFGQSSIKYRTYSMGHWTWAETFGGKLTENVVQAIARDCLRDSMLRVAAEYPRICMHIHDEMVVEVPTEQAQEALDRIQALMGQPIEWAPGLVLRGDGYLCDYYRKD